MMALKKLVRKLATTLAVVGALTAGLMTVSAASASASVISNGNLQICAQGNYSVFIHALPVYQGGWSTGDFASTIVTPGNCWMNPISSAGQWRQVDVVGLHNGTGQEFYIGTVWYNSAVSGIGIGAEGSEWQPYLWTW